MRADHPALPISTGIFRLGTPAVALAPIIGHTWWNTQHRLTSHAEEKVNAVAQFLENWMALLAKGGAAVEALHCPEAKARKENGGRRPEIAGQVAIATEPEPV